MQALTELLLRQLFGIDCHHHSWRDENTDRGEFSLHVIKELLGGHLFRQTRLGVGRGNIAPQDLHHIIEQQAKGGLKHRGLRCTADQSAQGEHFGDLLKDSLDAPAG